jgi:hypothetical protein
MGLLGEFLLRHKLILRNETISRVRGESARFGEICFPPQGLVLPGNSTDVDIGVDLLGLKYWGWL